MKKLMVLLIFTSLLFLSACNFLGNDTEEVIDVDYTNYIKVSTSEELKNMDLNKSYVLDQDINLNGEEWIPIGNLNNPFKGHFKGQGYTITNFKITDNHLAYVGLFGYTEGDIENLNITDALISIESNFLVNAGLLAGVSYGSISGVSVEGSISINSSMGNVYAGLLIGNAHTHINRLVVASEFKPKEISNNLAMGRLSIESNEIVYAGGLIGKALNVKVKNNIVEAVEINLQSKMNAYIGGLLGHYFLYDVETIEPSLYLNKELLLNNIVEVDFNISKTASLSLGGLVGYMQNALVINNFVVMDLVVGADAYNIGLITGENWHLSINNNLAFLKSAMLPMDPQSSVNPVAGVSYGSDLVLSSYYSSVTGMDYSEEQGIYIEETMLRNGNDFYTTNFPSLDETFIAKVKQIFFE